MAITLTEKAAKKIQAQIAKNSNGGVGLRVGVRQVGCSGYAYTFDYADSARDGDQVFESQNVMLIVDAISLPFVDGAQFDLVKEGFNETLQITNPNAESECGCGESFNLKK